jgi:HAD superfamily hydrolase (TIGR01509 family)
MNSRSTAPWKAAGKSPEMPKPRAVVFDLGKVLLDFDYDIAIQKMASHCAMPPAELHSLLNQSPLLYRYETGLITTPAFFAEVKRLSRFAPEFSVFELIFGNIFSPVPEMIALHHSIRAAGLPTAIFSNTNEMAVRHIRQNYPFFSEFDHHIYSFEHKAMKPSAAIYELVEKTLGLHGPEILYIDDRHENAEAGRARGWTVIHHQTPAATIATVKSLLPSLSLS